MLEIIIIFLSLLLPKAEVPPTLQLEEGIYEMQEFPILIDGWDGEPFLSEAKIQFKKNQWQIYWEDYETEPVVLRSKGRFLIGTVTEKRHTSFYEFKISLEVINNKSIRTMVEILNSSEGCEPWVDCYVGVGHKVNLQEGLNN